MSRASEVRFELLQALGRSIINLSRLSGRPVHRRQFWAVMRREAGVSGFSRPGELSSGQLDAAIARARAWLELVIAEVLQGDQGASLAS